MKPEKQEAFVGIDCALEKHDYKIMTQTKTVLGYGTIRNRKEDAKKMVEKLRKIEEEHSITLGIITDVLVFHSDFIEKNPDKVQAIIKSMAEAREFVKNNKDEAIKIMAEAENMSEEDMEAGLDGVIQPDIEEMIVSMTDVNDANSLYSSGEIISNFYISRGQMSKKPDLSEIIEPRFIKGIE